jgi:hypothetical protein
MCADTYCQDLEDAVVTKMAPLLLTNSGQLDQIEVVHFNTIDDIMALFERHTSHATTAAGWLSVQEADASGFGKPFNARRIEERVSFKLACGIPTLKALSDRKTIYYKLRLLMWNNVWDTRFTEAQQPTNFQFGDIKPGIAAYIDNNDMAGALFTFFVTVTGHCETLTV